jgi:hypothetical protein
MQAMHLKGKIFQLLVGRQSMENGKSEPGIRVLSLILADHIYKDEASGKYIIAGTFHQINVASFPARFGRTIWAYFSLLGVNGTAAVTLTFLETTTGNVLMGTKSLEINNQNPENPIDFAIEVPPMPLPAEGRYLFQLSVNGSLLTGIPVTAVKEKTIGGLS